MCSPGEARRVFVQLERTPDLCRGHHRLAAEVVLAQRRGEFVPPAALTRAMAIIEVLAA